MNANENLIREIECHSEEQRNYKRYEYMSNNNATYSLRIFNDAYYRKGGK